MKLKDVDLAIQKTLNSFKQGVRYRFSDKAWELINDNGDHFGCSWPYSDGGAKVATSPAYNSFVLTGAKVNFSVLVTGKECHTPYKTCGVYKMVENALEMGGSSSMGRLAIAFAFLDFENFVEYESEDKFHGKTVEIEGAKYQLNKVVQP